MHRKILPFLLAGVLLASTACGSGAASSTSVVSSSAPDAGSSSVQSTAVTFADSTGATVTVDSPRCVAALSGSFADIWQLSGGTVAAVTRDAFTERDLHLPESVADVGSLMSPDAETLLSIGVDFALLTPALSGQTELGNTLKAAGVSCAFFEVETFDEYLHMLEVCTHITGRTDLYETNGLAVKKQVDAVVADCAGKDAPTVLLLRASSTNVKAKNSDNMVGAMLADLGCVNIADSNTSLLEDLSMEAILAADPDFIFLTTQGDSDAAAATIADTLEANPAWAGLRAVQEGRCVTLAKDLFQYKPNARWGESYETLANILYGQA